MTRDELQKQLNAYGVKRSPKDVCGKRMGKYLYVHSSAATPYLTPEVRDYLYRLLDARQGHQGAIVKLDVTREPYAFVSLTEVPNWDDENEPRLGRSHGLNENGAWEVREPSKSPLVYHHRFLFVPTDYEGFDVKASMLRSLKWKRIAGKNNPEISRRIGRLAFWEQWLAQNNLAL